MKLNRKIKEKILKKQKRKFLRQLKKGNGRLEGLYKYFKKETKNFKKIYLFIFRFSVEDIRKNISKRHMFTRKFKIISNKMYYLNNFGK